MLTVTSNTGFPRVTAAQKRKAKKTEAHIKFIIDSIKMGKIASGQGVPNFTDHAIRGIRLLDGVVDYQDLAKELGVHNRCIDAIFKRESYAHVI